MSYRIAGIDVHKQMLAVVVADVEGEGEYQLSGAGRAAIRNSCERCRNGCSSSRSRTR
jgi:hypothetical protein